MRGSSRHPFLLLVLLGIVASALATALTTTIGGGATLRTGLPQAALATFPFLASPLRKGTPQGLRAARDRLGLACAAVLGLVVAGFGGVRLAEGTSFGLRVVPGIVVVLGVTVTVLAVRVLARARATTTGNPPAAD